MFGLAVTHTFLITKFKKFGDRFPEGSIGENFFHLLGEAEGAVMVWAGAFVMVGLGIMLGWHDGTIHYINSIDYKEPLFVFAILIVASTKPIKDLADLIIRNLARLVPLPGSAGFLVALLVIGPLLGSLITEPGAMTITASILLVQFFQRDISTKLRYAIFGMLFVHVSIGGTATHFAAPPVVMVAASFGWDMGHMFWNFGIKAILAMLINVTALVAIFWKELTNLKPLDDSDLHGEGSAEMPKAPIWVTIAHLIALGFTVAHAHEPPMFMMGLVFFILFLQVTKEYQEKLEKSVMNALYVGGFLMGLVALGRLQSWWLKPLLTELPDTGLFVGGIGLTAIVDNAALTYLTSLVEGILNTAKYLIVAAAVTGGGLTIIANAPNPIGYQILKHTFKSNGKDYSPVGLLVAALPPTVVAALVFYLWQ